MMIVHGKQLPSLVCARHCTKIHTHTYAHTYMPTVSYSKMKTNLISVLYPGIPGDMVQVTKGNISKRCQDRRNLRVLFPQKPVRITVSIIGWVGDPCSGENAVIIFPGPTDGNCAFRMGWEVGQEKYVWLSRFWAEEFSWLECNGGEKGTSSNLWSLSWDCVVSLFWKTLLEGLVWPSGREFFSRTLQRVSAGLPDRDSVPSWQGLQIGWCLWRS